MDLSSPISDLPNVGPIFQRKFSKLDIKTIRDLVCHIPSRYEDFSLITKISKLYPGQTATVHAKIVSLKNIFSRRGLRMQIGSVEDETGKIQVIWFNQPFLLRTLYPGRLVSLSGKVGFFNKKLVFSSPDYELLTDDTTETLHTGRLVPIYPETAGLSSKWIRRTLVRTIKNKYLTISETLPSHVLKKYKLKKLEDAINSVHFPKSLKEASEGRRRLAFDELLDLQLKSQCRKIDWKKNKVSNTLVVQKSLMNQFIKQLPFELTSSQKQAIKELTEDLAKPVPMNRLLEGDVGSGKTVVAAAGALVAFANGFQTVIMAPTQILANQHYETFKKLFSEFKIRISLITSGPKKMEIGRSDVFIGTHALIHKKIVFDKVAFVVIDEQHRFGVEQRARLAKKSGTPHILTMTATPIPRTIALTTYGDLDLSQLTEMPKGRQKVITWVIPEKKRSAAYDWIHPQITIHKAQVFIVCPLIEDSQTETLADVKSVTSEFERLKEVFSKLKLGLIHGRMKAEEKDKVLSAFRSGKINILVATPVVEVGIDIPNATIMLIESAERYGLAQLHQLRGRVGRSDKKSYCLLFSNFHSGNAFRRLKAMEKSHSGFELAELDLKMRGPGEIFGTLQSGFPELKIASWSDGTLIASTKKLALDILNQPGKYERLLATTTNVFPV